MKNKTLYILSVILILILAGSFFYNRGPKSITKTTYKMGTVVKIKVYSSKADNVVQEAFDLLDDLEKKMSSHLESSEINQINKKAGQKAVKVSDDTYQVISKALEYAELSQGRFDPTIGPVVNLWGIGTEEQQIPSDELLKEKMKLVDYKQVQMNPEEKKIKLLKKGMELDVGGIAKGYAADKVINLFKEQGVKNAFISLGGNVSVLGTKTDGTNWGVGIQDPKASRGEVMASIEVKNKTVVTSGNYERYFEKDDVRYHHLLNPNTGRPARNEVISTTIVTDNSLEADALATIVYIMGVDEGFELIKQLSHVQALVVTENNKIYVTKELEDKINLLQDDKYQIVN